MRPSQVDRADGDRGVLEGDPVELGEELVGGRAAVGPLSVLASIIGSIAMGPPGSASPPSPAATRGHYLPNRTQGGRTTTLCDRTAVSAVRRDRASVGADLAATVTAPARVAQTAEQLTRNEQVRSSILLSGSHSLAFSAPAPTVGDAIRAVFYGPHLAGSRWSVHRSAPGAASRLARRGPRYGPRNE